MDAIRDTNFLSEDELDKVVGGSTPLIAKTLNNNELGEIVSASPAEILNTDSSRAKVQIYNWQKARKTPITGHD